jgi:DNA invertase Pin-like site-specific DNA recombinase
MKIAFYAISPGFPLSVQRTAGDAWGAQKSYERGVDALILALRKGDVLGVCGLHVLAQNWRSLEAILDRIEKRGATIWDLEKNAPAGMASMARAKSVFTGHAIFSKGDGPVERGRKGGKPPRANLTAKHEKIWRDVKTYRTNEDAARAISKVEKVLVTVRMLQRRFKASGRPGGWPKKT